MYSLPVPFLSPSCSLPVFFLAFPVPSTSVRGVFFTTHHDIEILLAFRHVEAGPGHAAGMGTGASSARNMRSRRHCQTWIVTDGEQGKKKKKEKTEKREKRTKLTSNNLLVGVNGIAAGAALGLERKMLAFHSGLMYESEVEERSMRVKLSYEV